MEINVEIKALLLSIGSADIDEELLHEFIGTNISSAGLALVWSLSSSNSVATG